VGLLKAIAASHGFPTATMHLNLDFASQIGLYLYRTLSQHRRARNAGDWIFSPCAFGDEAPDPSGLFLGDCRDRLAFRDEQLAVLDHCRRKVVPAFLDKMVEEIDWSRYRVVGFTSTFAQTVPSLALAKMLKCKHPELVVIFGGANLEGPMGVELVRTMECIDYAVTGEGDVAFTELLVALSEGRDPECLPGVLSRRDGQVTASAPAARFDRLDDLPTPDYGEYFERAAHLGILPEHRRHEVWLPAESARGCWWGQKRHCTFCGLNGMSMTYRAKSSQRLRRELAELAAQTSATQFSFVDNILDPSYFEELFPALRDDELDYSFFFEIKSNISRRQLRILAEGGVHRIQPGIESLSSHVLGLMRKGVRAAQNVNVLRWARHYGIEVNWNLLYGFPHEDAEDYRRQTELISKLVHLQPPDVSDRIWMERFSPIFSDREAFPARWIVPERGLSYIYPARVELDQLAYFFEYELEHTLPDSAYEEIRKAVTSWKEVYARTERPSLNVRRADTFIQVVDGRDHDVVGVHTFEDPLASIYLGLMDKPLTARALTEELRLPNRVEEVEEALDEFTARGLMMRDGNLFLSLALPATARR